MRSFLGAMALAVFLMAAHSAVTAGTLSNVFTNELAAEKQLLDDGWRHVFILGYRRNGCESLPNASDLDTRTGFWGIDSEGVERTGTVCTEVFAERGVVVVDPRPIR